MNIATHQLDSTKRPGCHRLSALLCVSGVALSLSAAPAASVDVIQGDWHFRYTDLDNRTHAVRLGQMEQMEIYDQQPDGGNTYRALGPFGTSRPFPRITTSREGKASAMLEKFEAGGIDPAGRILAATGGGSVAVSMNFKRDDDTACAFHFGQSPAGSNIYGNVAGADAGRDIEGACEGTSRRSNCAACRSPAAWRWRRAFSRGVAGALSINVGPDDAREDYPPGRRVIPRAGGTNPGQRGFGACVAPHP